MVNDLRTQQRPVASRGEPATSLTRDLVRLVRRKPVAAEDLAAAAGFALDAVANIIAGTNSPPGGKLLAWARSLVPGGKLSGLDTGRQAFLMGALCHTLEVDDLHRASVVHPGCVVVPAMLALGNGADGRQCLTALLHGFEATTRLGMAVGPAHYRIWHNTATCGPFGSALAAAYLLDLDEDAAVDALGNAGSQAAGLWEFLDSGAETKHLHAGRGAEAGAVAAGLARFGFTGASRILEGDRGFFRAACPDAHPERLIEAPDAPWQVHATSIKPWASCRHTHPAIACGLDLHDQLRRRGCSVAEISGIDATAYQAALDLCDRPAPQSPYAAKFSLQHCIAAAIIDGRVDFASFEAPARERLAGLGKRVRVAAGEPFQSAYPAAWGTRIEVTLRNGTNLTSETRHAKGDPEAPLSREELVAKAENLLAHGGIDDPKRLAEAILAMAEGSPAPDVIGEIEKVSRQPKDRSSPRNSE